MQDKVDYLKKRAEIFHALLMKYAPEDDDAESLLRWLEPLFIDVKRGNIIPPQRYEFRMALGKEPPFYDRHRDVFSAEADFMSALEDWESQDWYKRLEADE
jgi:hypothetical protein